MAQELDPRCLGIKAVYAMYQKTVRDTVEEFIQKYSLNPLDATDIRRQLLDKDIMTLHTPITKDEEFEAMEWLCNLRKRAGRT